MEADFWHERWRLGQIGFHQPEHHPALERWWHHLGIAPGGRVLVPLCGRSLDMVWLARRGHPVLGIELSPVAAAGFFAHASLTPERAAAGPFMRLAAGTYEILEGDFFDLTASALGEVAGWYDRAALIALPDGMRRRYAELLGRLLPAGARGLLITHDYDQARMEGPPFSVPVDEVRDLFGGAFGVELLERHETISANPRLAERGLDSFREAVFRLVRR